MFFLTIFPKFFLIETHLSKAFFQSLLQLFLSWVLKISDAFYEQKTQTTHIGLRSTGKSYKTELVEDHKNSEIQIICIFVF